MKDNLLGAWPQGGCGGSVQAQLGKVILPHTLY